MRNFIILEAVLDSTDVGSALGSSTVLISYDNIFCLTTNTDSSGIFQSVTTLNTHGTQRV